jgi:phosphate starvation-inducible protein PhoH|tara:strand:+ start:162 stop:845 length:684 start_codon:yes stop_codon:yes gene_type:complete
MNKKPSKLRLEHLAKLEPLTSNQKIAFDGFASGSHLCLDGSAGTGKTFISLYLALESVFKKEYSKVIIVRSAVPTRDMGFLPGTQEEKEDAYTAPYKAIVNDLFDDTDAWSKLVQSRQIEFLTTSFIRGLTIKDAVVIVDESQNCNYHELCSVITRLDEECRFIMSGDYYQSDFTRKGDQDGIKDFIEIIKHMNGFEHVEFTWEDIVRSGFVRDFIMTKELYENGKL